MRSSCLFADPSGVTERTRMRKITWAFTGLAAAALAVGMAGPALAATQARPLERSRRTQRSNPDPGSRSSTGTAN